MATTIKTILHEISIPHPACPEELPPIGTTTVVREDGSKRSRVVARSSTGEDTLVLGEFRFNNIPERFEHPLLSWLNVWFRYKHPDEEYAKNAVSNGTRLLYLATPEQEDDDIYNYLPEGVKILPSDCVNGLNQKVFYLYRDGCLADHFDMSQVVEFYKKLGIFLPESSICMMGHIWDMPITDYLQKSGVTLDEYINQKGNATFLLVVHEVMMGLLLGWPLEATASRLEKIVPPPVKEKKPRFGTVPTSILYQTEHHIPRPFVQCLFGEDKELHMESVIALYEGDTRCKVSFYSGYKGTPLREMKSHGYYRFNRTESVFSSPYVRWGFAPFGEKRVTAEEDRISSVLRREKLALRLETDYAGICMDDDYQHFPSHEYDGISQYDLERNVFVLAKTAKKAYWKEWAQSLLPGNLILVDTNEVAMRNPYQDRDHDMAVYYICKPGYIKDYFNLEEVLTHMAALGANITDNRKNLMAQVWDMRIEQILNTERFYTLSDIYEDITFAYEVTYGLLLGWPLEVAAAKLEELKHL